ncbi:uncharacterized protein LOC133816324 [Humulus lupulus]|uniref:uncharacterized protein LOC133816324 n=1 Tax=Humulus lupulus TaxID=3486 RepID=UPI002B40905A|nr:uncharacterized protein LOC133816324 [Humulus lupulus]
MSFFYYDDQIGGRKVTDLEMEDARQWRAFGMADELRIVGSHYTWSNKQEDGARIISKLDWVFKNEAWVELFPNTDALTNRDVLSDHCYCIIKSLNVNVSGVKPFRFYNMWAEHSEFRDTVLKDWSKPIQASGLVRVMRKLDRLKHVLHKFNKVEVGDVQHMYSLAKDNYQQAQLRLQQNLHLAEFQHVVKAACLEFAFQSKIYESFLRQRSKITWLRFGDENTSYFHASLKKRKVENRITSFMDDQVQLIDNYEDVVAHFINHFKRLMGNPSLASTQV